MGQLAQQSLGLHQRSHLLDILMGVNRLLKKAKQAPQRGETDRRVRLQNGSLTVGDSKQSYGTEAYRIYRLVIPFGTISRSQTIAAFQI